MLPPSTSRPRPALRQQRSVPIRPSQPPAPPPAPQWTFPVRLRHLLGLAALGLLGGQVYPRVRSAWQAHDLGAHAADYALCMAGPTGPELLRDDLSGFRKLVRRRLIAAGPKETPFARCAKLSGELSGSAQIESAHAVTAGEFVEYGLSPAAPRTLTAVEVDLSQLAARAKAGWPFVQGSYARLVRPSLGAKEAMHPVAPPAPGLGRGLPAERALTERGVRTQDGLFLAVGAGAQRAFYQSSDGGGTFRPMLRGPVDEPAGSCGGRDSSRGFALSSREDGSLLVTAFAPNREPLTAAAVTGEHALLAVGCDDHGVVLAARREGAGAVELTVCATERPCAPLIAPSSAPFSPLDGEAFDVARVAGATVLAVERGGIVRVVSTRDDGRTWTPPTVAFDVGELGGPSARVPTRLTAVGSRLFLHGTARRSADGYPLLISDDQGASFRAPSPEPAVTPPLASRVRPHG